MGIDIEMAGVRIPLRPLIPADSRRCLKNFQRDFELMVNIAYTLYTVANPRSTTVFR